MAPPRPPAAAELLVADAVAVLHANGAESQRTAERVDQMAAALGTSARVDLGWSTSSLEFAGPDPGGAVRQVTATPAGIGMNRVMGVDTALDSLAEGTTTPDQAHQAVRDAAALPTANTLLFAAACALGASCLAIIFGAEHWQAVALIAAASAAGAYLRRGIARWGGSILWQAGAAAALAGLTGGLAAHLDISSSLRLAAVCPCMILVPGPHLLNGALDLAALRIPLGLARLTFATLTLLAIGAALLAGLKLGGATLAVDAPGRNVPLWLDAIAAGLVATCYGVFYSAPLRILVWPFLVGTGVHALRWTALEVWHLDAYVGAGLACLVAGTILLPIGRRFRIPFSAIGFASVVSLIPGVLIFRTMAGLAELQTAAGDQGQQLLLSTTDDAINALLTIAAMAFGFIVPAAVYQRLSTCRQRAAGHR